MIKNVIKRKLLCYFLAGALAVSFIGNVPSAKVYAEEIGGGKTVYGKRLFDSNYDSQNAYSGDDLGCTYTPGKTTFKVWSPEASSVVLCRYEKGDGGNVISETPMTKGDKGVWSTEVTGDIVNTYYTYKVTVDGTTKEAVDIYAKAAGVNGDRAMVVDLDSTDPDYWDKNYQREETLLSDAIIWEVHIRDFSIDVSSGVSPQNRGKYKAFTEKTTINGEGKVASCVDYLKQLGVTHVQLLPMYDYASLDETDASADSLSNYSWGYDPKNYNVPEGSYSSNPYDGNVRIKEMKEMIQALHNAGIKVIMDVSYSHTSDAGDSNFNKIMPDYYYKLNNDLSYNDQSGYGNSTRSESAMFCKFMIDSVSYWAEEYNLDGFRFDLMGIHDLSTMNKIRKALNSKFGNNTILLYGEGWSGDGTYDSNSAYKANESKLDNGIGYYNDQIREALKGGQKFDGTIGLLQTNYSSGDYLDPDEKWPNNVFGGIMGSVGYTSGEFGMWRPFWSKSSNCCLSYVSSHDNLTLWDKLTEGFGKDFLSVDDKMKRMNKMAGSVVLVSKGGVLMQAGEEFARTKNGDDNSCSSPDSVNKIDWNRVNTYSDIQSYYQGMVCIRKAFSGFRSILVRSNDNWNPDNNNIEWISKEETGITAFYETNNVPSEWERIAVLINNAVSGQTVELTASNEWVIIADGMKAGLEKISESGSSITVPGKSVMVAVPKDTFDKNNVTMNEPPVISCDTSFRVFSNEPFSFKVETSDPDGDTVTLEADGIPNGASFDADTGIFTWEAPAAGEYTVTLVAKDSKTVVTKIVTITIIEKTLQLRELIQQAEKKNYQKEDFTEQVWQAFENALANAEELVGKNETDNAKIQEALHSLNEAYQNINKEAAAKEGFADAFEKAKIRLAAARKYPADYEAEAVADLEAVISDIEEFIKSVHSAEKYQSKEEDLEYAVKACVCLKAKPVIRIKADGWSNPAVYVWTGEGDSTVKLTGDWPGVKLSEKDSEGWLIFELMEETTGYSLIVNDGTTGTDIQTAEITGITGSVDVTVTSFSEKECTYTKQEHEMESGVPEPDKTVLSIQIAKAENVIKENPDSKNLAALKKSYDEAKTVYQASDASQVDINKSARALKKSITAVLEESTGQPEEPGGNPEEPDEPGGNPSEPDVNPIGPGWNPSEPGWVPAEPTLEPAKPDVKPAEPAVEPTKPGVKPAEPTMEPTKPDVEPAKPGEEPVKPDKEPSTEETIKKLKITNFVIGKASGMAQVGDNISISVQSAGGTGVIKYRFLVKRNSSTVIRNYSTSSSAKWKPQKAGKYSITVYAKDDSGKVAKKTISKYTVNNKLKISSFKASPSSKKAKAGQKVKLMVNASGGTEKYQYKFGYKISGTKKMKKISNYSSKKNINWWPEESGKYKLYVYVRDKKTKRTIKKTIHKYIVSRI